MAKIKPKLSKSKSSQWEIIDDVSTMGYRDDSPYRNRKSIDIHSPNGLIDMSETGMPIFANGRYLPPYSGMHQFEPGVVREEKVMKDGGQYLTVDGEYHRVYRNAEGDIMVNHPKEDKGKWDTINLTDKSDANTIAEGVSSVKKWHKENPYAFGGNVILERYKGGGSVSDKKSTLSKLKKALSLRENLGNLDTEQGYNTPLKQVLRTAIGLEGEDFSNDFMNPLAREQDAFRMYLGLPSKTGAFEQTGSNKYRIRDYDKLYPDTLLSDEAVKDWGVPHEDGVPDPVDKSFDLYPYDDFVMGKHYVTKGKDKKGEYLKYYDKFNFDPTKHADEWIDENINPKLAKYLKKATPVLDKLESAIFNPFELEDKVYYDPKTKLRSDIVSQQNKQKVYPGQPIAISADFKSGGEMIKRADGSYSRRGLWDNIRENAGSGKKPTKEMLKQEKKIKASEKKANGGSIGEWEILEEAKDGKKISLEDFKPRNPNSNERIQQEIVNKDKLNRVTKGSKENPVNLEEITVSAPRNRNPVTAQAAATRWKEENPELQGSSAELASALFATPIREFFHTPSRVANYLTGAYKNQDLGFNPYNSELSQTLGLETNPDNAWHSVRNFFVDNAADFVVPMMPKVTNAFVKNRALNILGQHAGSGRTPEQILQGIFLNKPRQYFGSMANYEGIYGAGKRDLNKLLLYEDATGFKPIKYFDEGINPNLKTFEMNSRVKSGEPLYWKRLAEEIKGSNPEIEFHPDFTKNIDKFKSSMEELAELKGKDRIAFDIQPKQDYKGLRLTHNPIYPEDDVAGHMGYYDIKNHEWTSRDQWGFTPSYDVKYKTTPFQKLQRKLVEKVGTPFNLAQKNPISFTEDLNYKPKTVYNLDDDLELIVKNKDYFSKSKDLKDFYKSTKKESGGKVNTDWEIVSD